VLDGEHTGDVGIYHGEPVLQTHLVRLLQRECPADAVDHAVQRIALLWQLLQHLAAALPNLDVALVINTTDVKVFFL